MQLHEFSRLSNEEKIDLLYTQGVYIGKGHKGGMITLLYQYEDFYTEIYYRRYRRTIHRICCFTDMARLNPYLSQVKIESLALGV